MRLLASLEHYIASTDEGGLQIHQYATGRYAACMAGDAVVVSTRTDFPWSGTVRLTVEDCSANRAWTLSLRIPQWCADHRVSVAGNGAVSAVSVAGWLRLERRWAPGDEVTLELAMAPRLVEADSRADAVRSCVAIERGPLVYCLEGVDNPGGGLDDIVLDPARALTEEPHPELLGGVITVTASGYRRTLPDDGWWPYRDTSRAAELTAARRTDPDDGVLTLTAVPYYAWANRQDGPMRVWVPTR
jgi:hypothetical protein